MKHTILYDASKQEDVAKAARLLQQGGLVGIPTETVYGLAADALNEEACRGIFQAKGRPADNPLIVHICDIKQLYTLVREVPETALRLAEQFWPGPLTIILPKAPCIPDAVSAGLDTVAVRFPSHPAAQAIIRESGLPLAAPSANLSGRPSPTTAAHVMHDLGGKIDAVLDGGPCSVGLESTVITLAADPPRLLRPGGVTLEQLRAVLGEVILDPAVMNPLAEGAAAASPGMKYKHYAPRANVILLEGSREAFLRYVNSHRQNAGALCYAGDEAELQVPAVCCGGEGDSASQAHELFDALRRLDGLGVSTVYARCPGTSGVGLAVYNRLIRAAGFEVLKLE